MQAPATAAVINVWGFEIALDPTWDARPEHRNSVRWAIDRGYVTRREDAREVLSVPWEDWDGIASGPVSSDPEDQERWAFEHESIARLFRLEHERLRIEAVGHVGGAHLALRLLVNDKPLDLKGSNARSFWTADGKTLLLSPLAHRLAEQARAFATSETHTRAEHLTFIARVKATQALTDGFRAVQQRLTISLDPHLESFQIEHPTEFSAKWVEDGKSRVSLQVFVKGHKQPLPLANLDEDSPIVDLDGRKTVLLSPGAKTLASHARAHQRTRKDRVAPAALRSPFALLGDDVDTTGIDFSEYALEDFSHRVLGFEPARRDTETATYSSGTPWYEKDGAGRPRFLIRATTPEGCWRSRGSAGIR